MVDYSILGGVMFALLGIALFAVGGTYFSAEQAGLERFLEIDANRNGQLTRAELTTMFQTRVLENLHKTQDRFESADRAGRSSSLTTTV
jgi:hypothetical protein